MSVIDDIKKELGEISPWPWLRTTHGIVSRTGSAPLPQGVDLKFIAQSPERIQVLLEYVEANEDLIALKTLHAIFNKPGGKNLRAARKRAVAARKKLGLA